MVPKKCDINETITILPEQPHPAPLTHSEAEIATGGFSLTFLADLMNSATALTEQVTETLAATTLIVEGIQQVGASSPQPTVDGIVQQLPTSVVHVMEAAAANSQALQTLTHAAGSATATAQQSIAIASKVQLLMVERVPQVYEYLQQGNIEAAIQCGEQVLSELAAALHSKEILPMAQILVIDDDAASRAALTRLLTQSGYDVRTAADGSEGLRCMAQSLPDVLLVDIFMPERDGLETIRLVCRAFPQVAIIAMSGGTGRHETGDVLTAAHDFGARYTFTKSFAPEALLATLQAVTGADSM